MPENKKFLDETGLAQVAEVVNSKARIFYGTQAEWNELTTAERKVYDYAAFGDGGGSITAMTVSYDNTESGLESTNVQGAIDEVNEKADAIPSLSSIQDAIFPVGSVYMTIGDTSPATLLGFGTWSKLSDGYLRIGGSAATGGSLTTGGHAITEAEMPSHSHSIAHTHSVSGDTGAMSGNNIGRAWFPTQFVDKDNFQFMPAFTSTSGNIKGIDTNTTYAVEVLATQQVGPALLEIDVSHTHSINITSGNPSNGDSGSAGSGDAHTHSIEPTYTRIYAWQRTA